MTIQARTALNDCKLALELLEEEKDFARWRVLWVSAITLCRLVGHVLEKVDAQDSAEKKLVNDAYKEWKGDTPQHEIFREFIEKHRNTLLKEYEFNQHPMEAVPVAVEFLAQNPETGETWVNRQVANLDENIYRPLLGGYREGDDARDVLGEAINWWEDQLDTLENKIYAHRRRETSQ